MVVLDDDRYAELHTHVMHRVVVGAVLRYRRRRRKITRSSAPKRKRIRKSVNQVHAELGPQMFRRAYRMSLGTLKRLANLLKDSMHQILLKDGVQNQSFFVHNGPIHHEVRVAAAIRVFAGGALYDIATTFGIGVADVRKSIWVVVDAVNAHPSFKLSYPSDHEKQKEIAREFQGLSYAQFDCCAGAIDGLLIWTQKPTKADCLESTVDAGKYWCGRKHKYGLNLQGVSDARGRLLDVSIVFPASSSDCLAFEGSTLFGRLEEGLLGNGLCFFGDNAYLNSPYMATPYTAVSLDQDGQRDAYNFYFSQLRIRVECAFGMFVHRWAILRAPMPPNIPLKKVIAMVLCMARLHNYCIDNDSSVAYRRTATDELHSELNGAISLRRNSNGELIADELSFGNSHFDDISRGQRRERTIAAVQRTIAAVQRVLPRERLCAIVGEQALQRPAPIRQSN